MEKFATIDLGTNTFHLLIASINDAGEVEEFHRERYYIHLAEKGIEKIGQQAYDRAVSCVQAFQKILSEFEIKDILCSGTAALRTASNGPDLAKEIKNVLGTEVHIIDGLTEARYIYEGIQLADPSIHQGNHLIMDIGGGSVEFIIIKEGNFLYSNSFPIGVAILKKSFHRNEPISDSDIQEMDHFIHKHLKKLMHNAKGIEFDSLIGASGSFEVLANMVGKTYENHITELQLTDFYFFYDSIIHQDFTQRLNRKDLPDNRASLIVVAFYLMHYILEHLSINTIKVSEYAMKEGMLKILADSSKKP